MLTLRFKSLFKRKKKATLLFSEHSFGEGGNKLLFRMLLIDFYSVYADLNNTAKPGSTLNTLVRGLLIIALKQVTMYLCYENNKEDV